MILSNNWQTRPDGLKRFHINSHYFSVTTVNTPVIIVTIPFLLRALRSSVVATKITFLILNIRLVNIKVQIYNYGYRKAATNSFDSERQEMSQLQPR